MLPWCKTGGLLVSLVVALITSSTNLQPTSGANILGVFLSPSPSHLIVHMSVMKTLAERGHNVTVVTGQRPKINHHRIHNIVIEATEARQKQMDAELSTLGTKKENMLVTMNKLLSTDNFMIALQFDALKNERFQAIYNMKFDLVIMGYFLNNFQWIVPAKLKCPIIMSWSGAPMEMVNGLVGVPQEISYVPSIFTPHKSGEVMSFLSRLINVFSVGLLHLMNFIMDLRMAARYNELAAGDPTLRTYWEMGQNISLLFCSSHFSEGPIRPLVPAVVEIGGIQIKETPEALPKDLSDFLNASTKNGAILFSLGSNMKGSNVQPQTVKIIYKVLSSLKQNVIWKWEDSENTPGNASNILYQKWLPQDDILAHPNLKLFITHAGKGGVTEATYHGVPMVAMPIFAEQPANAAKLVTSGYGVQVDITQLEEHVFRAAVLDVLSNPVYSNNVQTFSKLYRDRPLTAKESVVYWVKYVLRHHGAVHMQSPLVRMSFWQSNSLDVICVFCVAFYMLWKVLRMLVKVLYKLLCFGKKSKRD